MRFKLTTPKFFKEDVQRKLFSLFFACLIWYSVHQHISEVEIYKNIKVTIVPGSEQQVVVSISKPISIEVRGPKDVLDRLESKDIEVVHSGVFSRGVNEILIKEEDIQLPSDLRVEKIIEKRISVIIDVIEEKTVKVKLKLNKELSPNYALTVEPTATPNEVRVRGPRLQLAKLTYLFTEPVRIESNRTNDFRVTAKLLLPFDDISLNTNNVTVNVEIEKRLVKKSLPVQKVYIIYTGTSKKKLGVVVGEAFAFVSGPPEIINKIDVKKDVRLFVEVGDEEQESYEVKFWCRYADVVQESMTPSKLSIFKKEK
jgi:hypothetical protein